MPRPIGAAVVVTLVVAIGLVVLTPMAASADPAEPTNYESMVTDVEPRSDGVTFEIVGGDAYLAVEVDPGNTVVIPGYFDEPYVRISADGIVSVNVASAAYEINQSRLGQVSDATRDRIEEEWSIVSTDGTYAWHDHRTHWMSEDRPPTIDPSRQEVIFPWQVPVVVNGERAVVSGELTWVPNPNPIPGFLAGAFVLLPLLIWDRSRRSAPGYALAAALVAAAAALLLALGTPAAGRDFALVPPLTLIAAAGAAVSLATTRGRTLVTTLSVVSLLPVLLDLFPALRHPVIPSSIPVVVVVLASGAWWLAIGAVASLIGRTNTA